MQAAAFARLCVETCLACNWLELKLQPPSRGCVLKLQDIYPQSNIETAAAFARLCVETLPTVAMA